MWAVMVVLVVIMAMKDGVDGEAMVMMVGMTRGAIKGLLQRRRQKQVWSKGGNRCRPAP